MGTDRWERPGSGDRLDEIESLLATAHLLADELQLQGSSAPLTAVVVARELVRTAEEAMRTAIGQARKLGATWQEIGDLLGTTRQAAYQRFGRPPPEGGTGAAGPGRDASRAPVGPDGSPARRGPSGRGDEGSAESGVAVLAAWAAGRYDEVSSRFSDLVAARLDAEGLASTWERVTDRCGPLEQLGPPRYRRVGEVRIVEVRMRFARREMLGRVSTDPQGRIIGLGIVASPREQQRGSFT